MKKHHQAITKCPICHDDLHIKSLGCNTCHTEIKGEFSFSKFNYINKETLYFMEIFIKNRGNIKAIEKELNISYPTVKKYLDEAVVALGYSNEEEIEAEIYDEPVKKNNIDILEMIKNGNINVEDAINQIKKNKSGK